MMLLMICLLYAKTTGHVSWMVQTDSKVMYSVNTALTARRELGDPGETYYVEY